MDSPASKVQLLVENEDEALPQAVMDALLRAKNDSPILAWTQMDPMLESSLHKQLRMEWTKLCLQGLLFPCLFPCWAWDLCGQQTRRSEEIWVLTEESLYRVSLDTTFCGCASTGEEVLRLPLEDLSLYWCKDLQVEMPEAGCLRRKVPMMNVAGHEYNSVPNQRGPFKIACGYALKDVEVFAAAILRQHYLAKAKAESMDRGQTPAAALPVVSAERQEDAIRDRLALAEKLRSEGLITEEEYQDKRQDILASL